MPRRQRTLFDEYESAGATFDDLRIYRYSLHRLWGGGSLSHWSTLLWVMLNPSTADERVLDPTLRRVEGFTKALGFDGFEVVNLFALRSTNPDVLPGHPDPIGPENDRYIAEAADRLEKGDRIVVAWGQEKIAKARGVDVLQLLTAHQTWCLGTNADDSPRHPLYLAGNTPLTRFT